MGRLDELNAFQLLEIRSSPPDELLMYGDKLSMAHALEVRVPTSTGEVVELRAAIELLVLCTPRCVRKWPYRRSCREFFRTRCLRRKTRDLPSMLSTTVPANLFQGRIGDYLADNQSLIYGYPCHDTVTELVRWHFFRAADQLQNPFSLVVLEQMVRANSSPVDAIW